MAQIVGVVLDARLLLSGVQVLTPVAVGLEATLLAAHQQRPPVHRRDPLDGFACPGSPCLTARLTCRLELRPALADGVEPAHHRQSLVDQDEVTDCGLRLPLLMPVLAATTGLGGSVA